MSDDYHLAVQIGGIIHQNIKIIPAITDGVEGRVGLIKNSGGF